MENSLENQSSLEKGKAPEGSKRLRAGLKQVVDDTRTSTEQLTNDSRTTDAHLGWKEAGRKSAEKLPGTTRVAIIGAGMGGLAAGEQLTEYGIKPTIFEARGRVGGRMKSGKFSDGAIFEAGGELLNNKKQDPAIWQLAHKLGVDIAKIPESGLDESYIIDGKAVDYDEMAQEYKAIWRVIGADIERAGGAEGLNLNINTRNQVSEFTKELNHTSLDVYFAHLGMSDDLRKFLEVMYITENGKPLSEQSALNFLLVVAEGEPGNLDDVFGNSSEDHKFTHGNNSMTTALKNDILKKGGDVRFGHELKSIVQREDGSYDLHFQVDGEDDEIENFDVVGINVPLSVLSKVDMTKAELDPIRSAAVRDGGRGMYGDNGKVMLGVKSGKEKGILGKDGFAVGNGENDQMFWNTSAGRKVKEGQSTVLTQFNSKSIFDPAGMSKAEQAAMVAREAEKHFPGLLKALTGESHVKNFSDAKYTQGSYSSPLIHKYDQAGAIEIDPTNVRLRAKGLYFLGEHANAMGNEAQPGNGSYGFMRDAAESGMRFADQIGKTVRPDLYKQNRFRPNKRLTSGERLSAQQESSDRQSAV